MNKEKRFSPLIKFRVVKKFRRERNISDDKIEGCMRRAFQRMAYSIIKRGLEETNAERISEAFEIIIEHAVKLGWMWEEVPEFEELEIP